MYWNEQVATEAKLSAVRTELESLQKEHTASQLTAREKTLSLQQELQGTQERLTKLQREKGKENVSIYYVCALCTILSAFLLFL